MFLGGGGGRSAYPQIYSVHAAKKSPKKESHNKTKPKQDAALAAAALGPAMDGPPSPERIRAYTEQMKRGSIFGNSSRSNTISSTTLSSHSRESSSSGNDNTLSRKSSARSSNAQPNPYAMPETSPRAERPESMQLFGGLFTRSGKKSRKISKARSTAVRGTTIEEEPAKGIPEASAEPRKHQISTPYNFQHVTHTQQEHLPSLDSKSPAKLRSEFSAVRASQSPTQGTLKGIAVQDLHFKNFSSESLTSPIPEEEAPPPISPKSPQRQLSVVARSVILPPHLLRAKSQEDLKSPPPRPPRSPLSPPCPIDPPARTSSRTASILYDTFDPLATTTLERPQTTGGFRRPAPFAPAPLIVLPPAPAWSETDRNLGDRSESHAVTTPKDEDWPLSASGTFGAGLTDVEEEEEDPGSQISRRSYSSNELRSSMSVPALRLKSMGQDSPSPQSEKGFDPRASAVIALQRPVLPATFQGLRDSWEDDVDFCYENEIEANFDYQWDQCDDFEESERTPPAVPIRELHFHMDERNQTAYHGRFRPSLLVPLTSDTPELSPMSDTSMPSLNPCTPSEFLRPISHTSSIFKESHGFNLSPSLLIPTDFKAQMEQESVYDEPYEPLASGSIFPPGNFEQSTSPIDESIYSTSSYRSSAFSRQSARSSSSTRISTVNSRGSQDSVTMLNKLHQSISSVSSLPEMIPAALRNDPSSESLVSLNPSVPEDRLDPAPVIDTAAPASGDRRGKSLADESGVRKGLNHFVPATPTDTEPKNLSPVVETSTEATESAKVKPAHRRKASVPLAGIDNAKFKMRARASTVSYGMVKARGSYGLFPPQS